MDYSKRQEVEDNGKDILSYKKRQNSIHILTTDAILADDIYERINDDFRMDHYSIIKPQTQSVKETAQEIDNKAANTVKSRVIIIDVRKMTLPIMQPAYNKVVGYNRRDLNNLCYIILIGDGPFDLFGRGDNLDSFVEMLGKRRVDYYQTAYFFDPFIHYEDEEEDNPAEGKLVLKNTVPKRLLSYFSKQDKVTVGHIRKFFRATGVSQDVKEKRMKILQDLFEKRIAEQFPSYKEKTSELMSKAGIELATEKIHLYPFGFNELVYELMEKAGQ